MVLHLARIHSWIDGGFIGKAGIKDR